MIGPQGVTADNAEKFISRHAAAQISKLDYLK